MRPITKPIHGHGIDQTYAALGWKQDAVVEAVVQTAEQFGMERYVKDKPRLTYITNQLVERLVKHPLLQHHKENASLRDLYLLLASPQRGVIKVLSQPVHSSFSVLSRDTREAKKTACLKPIDQLSTEDFATLREGMVKVNPSFFIDLFALTAVSKMIRKTLDVSPALVNNGPPSIDIVKRKEASPMSVASRLLVALKDDETRLLAVKFIEVVSNPENRQIMGNLFDGLEIGRGVSALLNTPGPAK